MDAPDIRKEDIHQFVEAAELAARLGGAVLQSWAGRFSVTEKGRANLVTEADFASQATIFSELRARFPDHGFLGEEGGPAPSGDSPFLWVIDPLDGTSNYVHRFPFYAVSIGLVYHRQTIAGVVFDPTRNELFSAGLGMGTKLNGQPLKTSSVTKLDQAMVVASLPVTPEQMETQVRRFLGMMLTAQTVQRTGSAALNLAYIAAGRMDGFFSNSLKPWDMAGGVLLVTEAGGIVTKVTGDTFDLMEPEVLAASTSSLHSELVAQLGKSL